MCFSSFVTRALGGVLLAGHLPWPVTQSSDSCCFSALLPPILLHFHCLTILVTPQPSSSILACGSRSHFHVTAPCLPISLPTSEPALVSSRRGEAGKSEIRSVQVRPMIPGNPYTVLSKYIITIYILGIPLESSLRGRCINGKQRCLLFRAAC